MEANEINNGLSLMKEILSQWDIRSLNDETLLKVLDELFNLEQRRINVIEAIVIKGRLNNIAKRYQIPLKQRPDNTPPASKNKTKK